MASNQPKALEGEGQQPPGSPLPPPPSFFDDWKERILIPTILGGMTGGGLGLVSKHGKVHGISNISATYATNCAIVAGCYCGAREFVRVTRKTEHDDLLNSAIGGFGTGALLGRLQGGQRGALRYSFIFAIAGTTIDYATLRLKPVLSNFSTGDWLQLPEWSPIRILDEEALAEKKAREQKLYELSALAKQSKEKSSQ